MSTVATTERPKVGVALFLLDPGGRFHLLCRQGSHGAGKWGLVGGHLEYGSNPRQTACEEAFEELGVTLDPAEVALGPYTNDVMADEGKHYVTLFASAWLPPGQVPFNKEPHKCSAFGTFGFDALPSPLFLPFENFVAQGVRPPFPAGTRGAGTG